MTILVFPSCLEPSARFASEARRWGRRVVGASCLDVDPYASCYDVWVRLPYVGDRDYFPALSALVDRENIEAIYSHHAPSFSFLKSELPSRLPRLAIFGEGPFETQMHETEQAFARAAGELETIRGFGLSGSLPTAEFLAGLLLQMDRLHGEFTREKALGFCAIMPTAVPGDVVEIGSFFGKSTYLLNRLASYFKVGATLAVDPWRVESSVYRDAPVFVQNMSRSWDWDIVYRGFLLNMLGCTCPPFNYMKATSAEAYTRYCTEPCVQSPEFGTTALSGSVSVLFIDGNHDEAVVAEDFALWSRRLAPGAWVVFDDYHWLHGDGPRKAADAALRAFAARERGRFLADGALFVNFGD